MKIKLNKEIIQCYKKELEKVKAELKLQKKIFLLWIWKIMRNSFHLEKTT